MARPLGSTNHRSIEFKEAINALLRYAAPEMTKWLTLIAETDPDKALTHVHKLAEYAYPKLGRTEHTGKDGGAIETKDVSRTDQAIIDHYLTTKGKTDVRNTTH